MCALNRFDVSSFSMRQFCGFLVLMNRLCNGQFAIHFHVFGRLSAIQLQLEGLKFLRISLPVPRRQLKWMKLVKIVKVLRKMNIYCWKWVQMIFDISHFDDAAVGLQSLAFLGSMFLFTFFKEKEIYIEINSCCWHCKTKMYDVFSLGAKKIIIARETGII